MIHFHNFLIQNPSTLNLNIFSINKIQLFESYKKNLAIFVFHRIVKEHAEGASFQNKTVEVLRDQLQQAEAELSRVKESLHQSQVSFYFRFIHYLTVLFMNTFQHS